MAYIGDNAIEFDPVETENIGSLAALVLAELPGADDIIVRQQLGFALREFCRETDACVIDQPCVAANRIGGRSVLPITMVPTGMVLGTVLDLAVRGLSAPFTVHDQPAPHVVADATICDGEPCRLRYSVYPKAGGESCPKWFKERYAEAITAGAMYHLLSMQGRAWANPSRAMQYGAKYTNFIEEAAYRRLGAASEGGAENAIPCGGLFM